MSTTHTNESLALAILHAVETPAVLRFECSLCRRELDAYTVRTLPTPSSYSPVTALTAFTDHVLYDHVGPADVTVLSSASL